jgi:hypothetical protein
MRERGDTGEMAQTRERGDTGEMAQTRGHGDKILSVSPFCAVFCCNGRHR